MLESPWEIPPAARPRLQRCTGGSDKVKGKNLNFHSRPDLQPVSRFTVKELKEHWLALVDFVLDAEASEEDRLRLLGITEEEDELSGMVKTWIAEHEISKDLKSGHRSAMSAEGIAGLYQKNTNPSVIPIPDPAHLEDLSLPFIFISADNLDNDKFDFLWGRGEPIVVNGVGKRLKHTWTPDTFIERFGSEPCCTYLYEHCDGG